MILVVIVGGFLALYWQLNGDRPLLEESKQEQTKYRRHGWHSARHRRCWEYRVRDGKGMRSNQISIPLVTRILERGRITCRTCRQIGPDDSGDSSRLHARQMAI